MKRLAARAAALPPRMQDLALALALAAYNAGSLIPEAHQLRLPYLAFVLALLQAVPLAWRRRWPVAVLLAIGIPRSFYDQLNLGFQPVPLASAIAYYTVMDRSSTRVRLVTSGLLLAGIIRSQTLPHHTEPYDFFVVALQFTVAGMAGVLSRTHRAYVREAEARADRAEAERDREVALAAAQERASIARELHDVVAHHVSLMAVQSEAAASLLPDRPAEAGRSVQIIGDTARETLTQLRQLLGVLRGPADPATRPSTAPSPSIGEIDEVLVQVRQAGIAVDLRVEGRPAKLAPGVELTAYRIVQEALTNTVRHSGAGEAAVTVSYEPGYVTVSVTDTGSVAAGAGREEKKPAHVRAGANGGRGRPDGPGEFGPAGGFGLAGIAERVASCGGSLTVGPGQGGGFAVTARLPAP
ncbi:MAG: sensor histidine kinase [Streptosporangiaceae bacterium]|nr:sensor histidine kinase [Streptosporangiaceae bacterium]MBV9853382.1 sensor histidine kinase [Streptosporangiaceae bacterium]